MLDEKYIPRFPNRAHSLLKIKKADFYPSVGEGSLSIRW
jgi:hypothetical protein